MVSKSGDYGELLQGTSANGHAQSRTRENADLAAAAPWQDCGRHALFSPTKYTFVCAGHRYVAEPAPHAIQRAIAHLRPTVGEGI